MMAKALKKPKEDLASRFPDLPFNIGADQAKIEAGKAAPDTATTIAQLQEQIANMGKEIGGLRDTNLALMTQAPVVAPQLKPTEVDTKGLPDPVTDPDKYAAELAQRTRTAIQNEQYNAGLATAQTKTNDQKIASLWEDFGSAYPELAKNSDRVEFIATKLTEKAARRGQDVNKYVFGATKTFFKDVAEEMEKVFGKAGETEEPEDKDDDDGEDNRARGLPGGGPSGRSAAPIDEDALVQGQSMFGGLKQWQQKHGFTI